MNYRLIKSEPYKYSRQQFVHEGGTMREGVRNFQARNNLALMKKGDLCLWYHSNEGKEIVGIARVVREHYRDPSSKDERRVVVDVQPLKPLPHPVTLEQVKKEKWLHSMILLKQPRLSVAPVTKEEYDRILTLANHK